MHPTGGRTRPSDMPTMELVSLIVALIVWIALLETIAPEA
jgi:hypothetical protein